MIVYHSLPEPKRIGIDLDGIVADMTTPFLSITNEIFFYSSNGNRKLERPLIPSDITRFYFYDCTPLTKDDMEMVRRVADEQHIIRNLKPLPHAIEGIKRLADQLELYFVTARGHDFSTAVDDSHVWLEKQSIPYEKENLIFDSQKVPVARDKKLSFFIEDKLETALALADDHELARYNMQVFLFDYPWNNDQSQPEVREANRHPRITRITPVVMPRHYNREHFSDQYCHWPVLLNLMKGYLH